MGWIWIFTLFLLLHSFMGLPGAGQEIIQLLSLYDTSPEVLEPTSISGSVAVSVSDQHLNGVSSSVLKAETWLRTHVLRHFPATNITTIVVGNTLLCQNAQDYNLPLLLSSLKNIFYSLTRWGLERVIKVSAAFSPNCFDLLRDDEQVAKDLLDFLLSINSTYSIALPSKFSSLSEEILNLVSSQTEFVKKFGSFRLEKVNVIVYNPENHKPMKRKLSTFDSKVVKPYPARPTPLREASQPPLHSSIGFSVPVNIAKNPVPPQAHTVSPPPLSIPLSAPPPMTSFAPKQPPFPATPPYGYSWPPCNPGYATAPAPEIQRFQKLWCVAKPSVPAETLQEAMDFACGKGGADCEEIKPYGNCFYPDTVVAHASYAFNSYWQKTKRNGGTCNFGGTAMIINSDPSFLHCQFVLS